ncbi:hypothetical protein SCA6_017222 [Theobroma cacao]
MDSVKCTSSLCLGIDSFEIVASQVLIECQQGVETPNHHSSTACSETLTSSEPDSQGKLQCCILVLTMEAPKGFEIAAAARQNKN